MNTRYSTPVVATVLYVLAALLLLAAAFLLLSAQATEGVICLVSAFALLAWGQMLEYIARAAFFTERVAHLMEEQQIAAKRAAEKSTVPRRLEDETDQPEPLVYPDAPTQAIHPEAKRALTILAEVEQAKRSMRDARSAYGQKSP